MRKVQNQIILSATDLVGHLNCRHLTARDVQVLEGKLPAPRHWDPLLEILRERGRLHEEAYLARLTSLGATPVRISGVEISDMAVAETLDAMRGGADIIVQAALRHGRWSGRADVLTKVQRASALGAWSYEVIDTKLARETKGSTVLQLCLYSDLLTQMQGLAPIFAYVVVPWSEFAEQPYRLDDYAAYFRKAKSAAEYATSTSELVETYPDPSAHCEVCRWQDTCDEQRRADDHLSFVAGISRTQITELKEQGIDRLAALAKIVVPLNWKPRRGATEAIERVAAQARLQFDARTSGELLHQLLGIESGQGLSLLPPPNLGDIFFDLEGDPFVGEHGLEYLFGYCFGGPDGKMQYIADWSFNRDQEKLAFERFMDFVADRLTKYPDLHIYHYAPYEPAALKRLMGRYATREEDLDSLLRGLRFVDLYSVVRNGVRASVESYSIKRLEPFYGFIRDVPLRDANTALAALQASLELGDVSAIDGASKVAVEGYNKDDCVSTAALREWLEGLRDRAVADGWEVERPTPGEANPTAEISEKQQRVNALVAQLLEGIPIDIDERSQEQQAQWTLANILDWHRREDKASWWEYFRLRDLSADDLIDDRSGLGGLEFAAAIPSEGKMAVHRYTFPQQDTDIRVGKKLKQVGGDSFGEVVAISSQDRSIDIKKTKKTTDIHARAVFAHEMVQAGEQAEALLRIGEHVVKHGIAADGPYLAARDLLLRLPPRLGGEPLAMEGESTLIAALRIANVFDGGVLPVQGPPGTGKSFTGARMICRFVQRGLRVGITSNSHKVIRNLLDKVIEAAAEMQVELRCVQKAGDLGENGDQLIFAKDNATLVDILASGDCQVGGATGFFWSRAEAHDLVDVLVIDEAGQMALANVLAVSHAAKRLILLGDPQQLDQPTQGSHPDGTGLSSLEHVLAGRQTIGAEQGLFLPHTWRMNPEICAFDSELFYEGKLHPIDGSQNQALESPTRVAGAGLRFLPVPHSGNKSYSIEEAEAVATLVTGILAAGTHWVDRQGDRHPLTLDDILIITPYNAQVFELQSLLPGARIGTVDKFQGQEAPLAIYSMATSSYAEAPRGMEFLYSANRFNVAVSRAMCQTILVASPDVFEAECKTPRQIQLVNAFCRYVEIATSS